MWVSGQWFSSEVIDRIAGAVLAAPSISRRALSKSVCEWLQWLDPNGKPREMSARKALLEMERRGAITLPASKPVANFDREVSKGKDRSPPEVAHIECSLEALGPIKLVAVSGANRDESAIWTNLMETHHYLGACTLRGAQLRYLIRSPEHGLLGGLSFSAATRRLKSRDKWIGWSERACLANLQQVVCNSRFLIAPGVKVPNLASHVLGASLGRLTGDWREKYGYEPLLVETFVDAQQFEGTCYRAANWERVGQTAGRADGFENGKKSSGKKDIYLYSLHSSARQLLCREPEDRLALRGNPGADADWVEEEFGGARLFDGRLRSRLYKLVRDFSGQPKELIPQASDGEEAAAVGAYRFFKNKRVTMDALLKGHVEATAQRASKEAIVLAVQDTTSLNYSAHPPKGVGPINTKKDKSVGLHLHDTIAFSTAGTPLGVLDAQCWARDPEKAGQAKDRNKRPIEQKESVKWLRSYRAVAQVQRLCPQTMFVSVGDREADIHELFEEALRTEGGPKLLVRAERTRKRQTTTGKPTPDEHEYLWTRMSREPVAGYQQVAIPKEGDRAKRTAKLEVRYASVTLKPPEGKNLKPVNVWAVYAREIEHAPDVKEPLEWMLLTTVEVSTFEHAIERLRWYTLRWGIEVYHRVLKSGCRIEDRQLGTAERIAKCLALDMVVAWRLYKLNKQCRETPDASCDKFLHEDEWMALHAVVKKKDPPLTTPPNLRDAIRMIAKLGGFLGRKSDGEPGTITLWRGLTRLDAIVIGYRAAMRQVLRQRAPPP